MKIIVKSLIEVKIKQSKANNNNNSIITLCTHLPEISKIIYCFFPIDTKRYRHWKSVL